MDEAYDYLERAWEAEEAGDLARAAKHYQRCLELHPSFAEAWYDYGDLLEKRCRLNAAMQAYEHATVEPALSAPAYLRIANIHLDRSRLEQAEAAVRKSLAIEQTVEAFLCLGFVLFGMNRTDEELACYRSAVELDPLDAQAHYHLGRCYRERDAYPQALPHLRRAIDLYPQYAQAYLELGVTLGRGNPDNAQLLEARTALETAVRLDPQNHSPRLSLAYALERLGRIRAAGYHYNAAVERAPFSALAHVCYGRFLSEKTTRQKRARLHLKTAVSLAPNYPYALYNLGRNLVRWGRRKQGEAHLKRAARLGSENAKRMLANLRPYTPKQHRWNRCAEYRAPLGPRHKYWCPECGADLRIKKCQTRFEYRSTERGELFRHGFEAVLPR